MVLGPFPPHQPVNALRAGRLDSLVRSGNARWAPTVCPLRCWGPSGDPNGPDQPALKGCTGLGGLSIGFLLPSASSVP